jgi:hypothetical protein
MYDNLKQIATTTTKPEQVYELVLYLLGFIGCAKIVPATFTCTGK